MKRAGHFNSIATYGCSTEPINMAGLTVVSALHIETTLLLVAQSAHRRMRNMHITLAFTAYRAICGRKKAPAGGAS